MYHSNVPFQTPKRSSPPGRISTKFKQRRDPLLVWSCVSAYVIIRNRSDFPWNCRSTFGTVRAIVSAASYFAAFSQLWFPTVQEVLHADWQEVWHSPHPPFFMDSFRFLVVKVLMCFIAISLLIFL